MNCKRPGNRTRVSGAGSGAVALASCLLLLAGCANPSRVGSGSAETAWPETAVVKQETAPTGREPRITLETDVHDFGAVGLLTRNVCEFHFKNTGTGILKVEKKIDVVCGCTVPVLS
jgi:hypothetical protein